MEAKFSNIYRKPSFSVPKGTEYLTQGQNCSKILAGLLLLLKAISHSYQVEVLHKLGLLLEEPHWNNSGPGSNSQHPMGH
jgi:hypothetical protein